MNATTDVNRWQTQPEGQFLERKSAIDRSRGRRRKAADIARDVAECLAAMANADGGELIVGIEDDGDVTGVPHPDDRIALIKRAPQDSNHVQPPLQFRVQDISTGDGKRLLHYEVDWSPNVHQLADGRYMLRVNDSNMPFPAEQIEAIKELKRRQAMEVRFEPSASLADLDPALLDEFREAIEQELSDEDLLVRYRLAAPRNGRLALTIAALLLFGRDPGRWHPRCGVDFVKYEGTDRGVGEGLNIVHRRQIEAPLTKLIEQVYEAVTPHVRERQRLVDLFFEERLEYPPFAWQEAVVNAVAHRDYSMEGTATTFEMFDDRLEIHSPGGLVSPVTLELLRERQPIHASRNPRLVRVLTAWGYMRDLGEGIPRMYLAMGRAGLRPPELTLEGDSVFAVTLRNAPVFSEETERWLKQFDHLGLTVDQRRLLAYAREHDGRFTSHAYQDLVGTDISGAQRDIRSLISSGVVQRTAKHGKVYELVHDAALQIAPAMPESLRPLLPMLRSQGKIANSDVRKALGVDRVEALRMLTAWHEAGWLEKSGARRWTRYSAGPRLSL